MEPTGGLLLLLLLGGAGYTARWLFKASPPVKYNVNHTVQHLTPPATWVRTDYANFTADGRRIMLFSEQARSAYVERITQEVLPKDEPYTNIWEAHWASNTVLGLRSSEQKWQFTNTDDRSLPCPATATGERMYTLSGDCDAVKTAVFVFEKQVFAQPVMSEAPQLLPSTFTGEAASDSDTIVAITSSPDRFTVFRGDRRDQHRIREFNFATILPTREIVLWTAANRKPILTFWALEDGIVPLRYWRLNCLSQGARVFVTLVALWGSFMALLYRTEDERDCVLENAYYVSVYAFAKADPLIDSIKVAPYNEKLQLTSSLTFEANVVTAMVAQRETETGLRPRVSITTIELLEDV